MSEIPLIDSDVPPGLLTVTYNDLEDVIYGLNRAGGWPFGGEDSIYAIHPGGRAEQVASGYFDGISMSRGGIFGRAIYVSQASSGKIMKVEADGSLTDVVTGLTTPSSISFNPVSGVLTVLCDQGKQIAWIGENLMEPAAGEPGTVGNYFVPVEQTYFQTGSSEVAGNRVEMSLPDSKVSSYHAVSKRALTGDFDVTVQVDMSPATLLSGQNRNALVYVLSDIAGQYNRQQAYIGILQKTVGNYSTGGNYSAYTDMRINGGWGRFKIRAMTDNSTSGTFRIKRTGSVITTHYLVNEEWLQLSVSDQGFQDRVRIHFHITTSWEATVPVAHSAVFREVVPNSSPLISGTPGTTVLEGDRYSFVPTGSDPDGDSLIYSINNKPSWADFDTTTGALTGTPAREDIGVTKDIIITVTDGNINAALTNFNLSVLGSSGITGQVLIDVAGNTDLPVKNCIVSLVDTGLSTSVDQEGNFAFSGLGSGEYLIKISVPGLKPVTNRVNVTTQQNLNLGQVRPVVGAYTQEELDQAVAIARSVCDTDGDGKIGLSEAIKALKTISGQ